MAHPYIRSSVAMVYQLFNAANGTYFNPTDALLSPPTVDNSGRDFRNTRVTVSGNAEEGLSGSVVFRYRRIEMDTVFPADIVISYVGQTNTHELLRDINELYGTKLGADDVELTYFNPTVLPINVTIKAKDTSYLWLGSIRVQVVTSQQNLATVISNNVFPVFDYPTLQSEKGQGTLVLRPFSFDDDWVFLWGITDGIVPNGATTTSLLSLINRNFADGFKWVNSDTPAVRNISSGSGVNILYAGPPRPEYTSLLHVDRIVVIGLGERCTGFSGHLTIHTTNPSVDLATVVRNTDIGRVDVIGGNRV